MKKILFPLLITLLLFGCVIESNDLPRIKVSGEVVKETIDLDNFTKLMIAGPMNIVIDQNEGNRADVETYESLMSLFRAEIIDDMLILYILNPNRSEEFHIESDIDRISSYAVISGSRIKWPNNKKILNVHLSVDDLDEITVIGECNITTAQPFESEELNLEVAGALHLDADLYVQNFNVEIAGACNLELRGSSTNFNVECAGAGTIEAYEFISDNITIEIAGVCNAEVYARESINVEIAGLGTVKYMGNAHTVNFDKAGIGKIVKIESEDIEL